MSVVTNALLVYKVLGTATLAYKLRRYAPLYHVLWFSTDIMPLRGYETPGRLVTAHQTDSQIL